MLRRSFLQLLTGAAVAPFVPVPEKSIVCLDEAAPVSPLLFYQKGLPIPPLPSFDYIDEIYLKPAVAAWWDEHDRRLASILTDGRSAFSLTKP